MKKDYTIERDVPLPKMRVGDSTVAPRTSQVAWHTVARRFGLSVKTQSAGKGAGKIRVWRTA